MILGICPYILSEHGIALKYNSSGTSDWAIMHTHDQGLYYAFR